MNDLDESQFINSLLLDKSIVADDDNDLQDLDNEKELINVLEMIPNILKEDEELSWRSLSDESYKSKSVVSFLNF